MITFLADIRIGTGRLVRNRLFYITMAILVLFLVLMAMGFRASNFMLLERLARRHGVYDIDPLINSRFFCYWVQYSAYLFLVPLFVSGFAASQIASEAGSGTLRQVLPRHRSRASFYLAKAAVTFGFTVSVYLGFMAVAWGVGELFFDRGDLLVLPNPTRLHYRLFVLPEAAGVRALALSAVLGAGTMLVLASLGLMISTLTRSAVHAVVTTVAIYFVGYAASSVPFIENMTRWLFTSGTDVWLDVYVRHIDWPRVAIKLAFCGAYLVTFVGVGAVVFVYKDVRS
jgi:ABC-2 type transport system permease protein